MLPPIKVLNICTEFAVLLTNHQFVVLGEVVLGDFQVQWCRTLSYTTRDIIVRTVARAEPTAKVACLTNWDTTKMRADTQHDQPFGSLDSLGIGLRISEAFDPEQYVSTCEEL